MPKNSLIDQSLAAKQSETTTNGDGFGIGWYGSRDEPGIYRDVRPAWNDANLRTLAAQIESRLFFAHIRAATGTAVQRTNCHPFRYRNWLFVHNGGIVGFPDIKRELVLAIEPVLPCKVDSPARGCRPFSLTLRKRCGNTTPPPCNDPTEFLIPTNANATACAPVTDTRGIDPGSASTANWLKIKRLKSRNLVLAGCGLPALTIAPYRAKQLDWTNV